MAGVREDLSESAKVARIGTWAAQLGLDAQETTAVLVEKYGPYAYDVMEAAVMKPSALMKNVGGRASSSKEAAEYMVKHIIPNESLAKVVNKDPAIIEAEMTRYRVEHPKEEETPEQREVRERQEQFNQHFNAEMERRGGAAMTVDPNTVDVSQMTLEDYAKYCKPEDRPAESYDALADAAYDDFAKGEGVCSQLYLDSMGYPTIGLGHLVFHPNYLDDPNQLRAARESYANLPLYGADGKPLSPEVKRRQFDAIKTAYQNKTFRTKGGCPNYVQIPITGTLKPEGIKQTFKQDFKYTYNTTKRVVPELDKMPLPVQLATLHMTFAYGNANKLKSVDVNSPV